MTENVVQIFPADDFASVLDEAKAEISCGLVLGYDEDGQLVAYGGGMIDGRRPVSRDWLWIVESFKFNLVSGKYSQQG